MSLVLLCTFWKTGTSAMYIIIVCILNFYTLCILLMYSIYFDMSVAAFYYKNQVQGVQIFVLWHLIAHELTRLLSSHQILLGYEWMPHACNASDRLERMKYLSVVLKVLMIYRSWEVSWVWEKNIFFKIMREEYNINIS